MIDCPICHVANEEMARFCAECGQRLINPSHSETPGSTAPPGSHPEIPPSLLESTNSAAGSLPRTSQSQHTSSPVTPPSEPSRAKLHSPLLDQTAIEPESNWETPSKALRSPLLGDPGLTPSKTSSSPTTSQSSAQQAGPRAGRGLRSPLLGGGEPDLESLPPFRSTGRGSLRSPLLGDAYPEDLDEPLTSHKPGGLRSPLLDGNLVSEPVSPVPRAPGQPSGSLSGSLRAGSLHSPLLGGHPAAAEGFAEESIIEDPNQLRSPLMATRRPIVAKDRQDRPEPPGQILHPAHQAASSANGSLGGRPSEAATPELTTVEAAQPPGVSQRVVFGPGNQPMAHIQESFDQAPLAVPVPGAEHQGFPPQPVPTPDRSPSVRRRPLPRAAEAFLSEPTAASSDAEGKAAGFSVLTMALMAGLLVAAVMKIMVLISFAQSGQPLIPVLADQVGQLMVIFAVLMLCTKLT